MDPGALHQALATQGALVGHHEQALQEIIETLRGLSTHVSQRSTQLTWVSSQFSASTPPTASTASSSASPTPYIPIPQHHSGDLERVGPFC